MKRTHKFKAIDVSQAARVIANAKTLTAAARQLGVNRSTLQRWIAAGKMAGPVAGGRRAKARHAGRFGSQQWARAIRQAYELTPADKELLDMAVEARAIARDVGLTAQVRLAAMGRFAALVRQLNLQEASDGDGEVETTETPSASVYRWPRKVG